MRPSRGRARSTPQAPPRRQALASMCFREGQRGKNEFLWTTTSRSCCCSSSALLFAALSFVASALLAPRKRPTAAKIAPYECGIVPAIEPPTRFPVRFYLIAMIFIIFDIEIVFLYPVGGHLPPAPVVRSGGGARVRRGGVHLVPLPDQQRGLCWGPAKRLVQRHAVAHLRARPSRGSPPDRGVPAVRCGRAASPRDPPAPAISDPDAPTTGDPAPVPTGPGRAA